MQIGITLPLLNTQFNVTIWNKISLAALLYNIILQGSQKDSKVPSGRPGQVDFLARQLTF